MNGKLNLPNLIRQLIPAHKRQPVRLGILEAFTAPLKSLFSLFDSWRDQTRILLHVSSQIAVLEGYLRKKYNLPGLYILTATDGALRVCLIGEGDTHRVNVPLSDDGKPAVKIPLTGELTDKLGGVDFVVFVPIWEDSERIRADVERFRPILATYGIEVLSGYTPLADCRGNRLTDDAGNILTIYKKANNGRN